MTRPVDPPTDAPPANRRSAGELVSIVVITFNRAEPLIACLRSVARLETQGEFDVELIVVDNASTDNTAEAVAAFSRGAPFPVRCVREDNPGIPFARNRGVREARGDWVCFFDDDQTAEPDWVLQLYRVARREGVECVGGARDLWIEDNLPAPESPLCRALLGECPADLPEADYHRRRLPNTGNVLIARGVFDAIGGFDEGALEGGDDTDFFHRLLKSGRRARFAPAALVHHHIPASRVTERYLQWVAQRHGVVMGRRDLGDGLPRFAYSLAARCGQAALVLLPQWAWLRLRGRRARALGPLCQIRRCQGFLRFALHRLTPTGLRSARALGSFQHRKSAEAARAAVGKSATGGGDARLHAKEVAL